MKIIRSVNEWRQWRATPSGSVGFVATMGHLHAGHASLLDRSLADNDLSVLSIYINPTQFNQDADLQHYPRTLEADLALARQHGVSAVLLPDDTTLYPDAYTYRVHETTVSGDLEGTHRPGHFDGVLSVVLKLLHWVAPDRAYFGEKDYQQYQLIKGMVHAFLMDVEVIGCPTVRETDGLAMSSRNSRLTAAQRKQATELYRTITQPLTDTACVQQLKQAGFSVDYVKTQHRRRYVAASLGDVRLIDNVAMEEQPC